MANKPLRILMTADTIGGVWTYCIELMQAMSSKPVHYYLACINNAPTEHQQLQLKQLKNVTVFSNHLQLEWMKDCWEDVRKTEGWLRYIAALIQPDLIHLNNFNSAFQNSSIPVITVFHSCVCSWWKSVKREEALAEWNKYRLHVARSLQSSSLIVAPSSSIQEEIFEIYPVSTTVRVIYNGCNGVSFKSSHKKLPILFSMGRLWDEAKNVKMLAEVARFLEWPVYVAGDSSGSNHLQEPNIHFLGKLTASEVKHWLARASIYISPALYEPFGLAILEAAFSGCAIVRSNIASLEEIWGSSALSFDPYHPQTLIDQVNGLIGNDEIRNDVAKTSLERALEFTAAKMATEYWQCYQDLLQENNRINQTKRKVESN